MRENAGAHPETMYLDTKPESAVKRQLQFKVASIARVLGRDVETAQARKILEGLGFEIRGIGVLAVAMMGLLAFGYSTRTKNTETAGAVQPSIHSQTASSALLELNMSSVTTSCASATPWKDEAKAIITLEI